MSFERDLWLEGEAYISFCGKYGFMVEVCRKTVTPVFSKDFAYSKQDIINAPIEQKDRMSGEVGMIRWFIFLLGNVSGGGRCEL